MAQQDGVESYQRRVIVEFDELNKKIIKLTAYLFSPEPVLPDLESEREKSILHDQLEVMKQYSQILSIRIARFQENKIRS